MAILLTDLAVIRRPVTAVLVAHRVAVTTVAALAVALPVVVTAIAALLRVPRAMALAPAMTGVLRPAVTVKVMAVSLGLVNLAGATLLLVAILVHRVVILRPASQRFPSLRGAVASRLSLTMPASALCAELAVRVHPQDRARLFAAKKCCKSPVWPTTIP